MKVVVAGGAGWIGSALCRSLAADGHEVIILSRSPSAVQHPAGVRAVFWDGRTVGAWAGEVDGADAVINLAGESIVRARRAKDPRRTILDSRVLPTKALVAALEQAARRPAVLANASAIGYYGDRGDEIVDEDDPPGSDFLARVVVEWEAAARGADALGVRLVLSRFALVLGPDGGALPQLALPFSLFLGGPIGSGDQWVSWVHMDDAVGLIRFALDTPSLSGPVNVSAPEPARYRDFAAAIGRALGRPSWLPVPRLAIRLLFGDLAEAVLAGQRVRPAVAEGIGYGFHEPRVDRALRRALGRAA